MKLASFLHLPFLVQTWLVYLWSRASGSLWFVPLVMSAGAVLLVYLCTLLDQALARLADGYVPLYAGDVDSARTVFSTLAGSTITVAGVSFSVTMVALSLTSSQFGPHLLANFMRDRGNQVVLGGFIGTFLFCLLALGTVTNGDEIYASVTATTALLLAAGSLMLLIYFIHHIASSMQADHVIGHTASHMNRALERVFPEQPDPPSPDHRPRVRDGEDAPTVTAPHTGYLQAVDEPGLIRLAARHDLCLRLLWRPGHYVIEDTPILVVHAAAAPDEYLTRRIQRGFIIGGHRTDEQDPEYGVHQLVGVAVRALSSGINDPFTAIACIDRLTGALCRIAPRAVRTPERKDDSGTTRLVLDPIDFAVVLDAAFDQIRQFSREMPAVSIRLLEGLAEIAAATDDPERREAVYRQARMLMADREERFIGGDRAALQERYRKLLRVDAAGA